MTDEKRYPLDKPVWWATVPAFGNIKCLAREMEDGSFLGIVIPDWFTEQYGSEDDRILQIHGAKDAFLFDELAGELVLSTSKRGLSNWISGPSIFVTTMLLNGVEIYRAEAIHR